MSILMKNLFFCFCAISLALQGNIEKYFKKIDGKEGFEHPMKNIDFIYMINLDQRPEKFAKSLALLSPYQIKPYRFSAVNGWQLSFKAIDELGVKFQAGMKPYDLMGTSYLEEDKGSARHEYLHVIGQTYFCHCMSRGAIGIVLSHLSILQDALNSGYKTIWVMEDDPQPIRDPRILSDLIERLDKVVGSTNWDVLFTDQDTKSNSGNYVPCYGYARRPNFTPPQPGIFQKRRNVDVFRQIGARYGAYSMIVRQSGMKKILEFIKKHQIFLPYDMDFFLPPDIHLYVVMDDVVSTQINAASDNGGANYARHQ